MKRYVGEAGTDSVRRWLREGTPATSRLSEVEVVSALVRRCRDGAFAAAARDRAITALVRDLDALMVVEIVPSVTARARGLLRRHPLRTGDALQLASCLLLRDATAGPIAFAAFDERLREAARAEGLQELG